MGICGAGRVWEVWGEEFWGIDDSIKACIKTINYLIIFDFFE